MSVPFFKSRRFFITTCALLFSAVLSLESAAQPPRREGGGPPPTGPRFEYVGPQSAGRFASIAGVPGDTMTYYAGAASGGIWKTTDGARTFAPIFDAMPVQAVGALAVAPSDSRTIWAGTGEAWAIRDGDMMGDGVYKSTDAGATWKNMGLVETGRIGRIVIHPTNKDIVFVCALGRSTGPQQERGVFRTTDGGSTWTRVLFVNENTGCSGLAINRTDPSVMIASTWQMVMHTWAMFSGGEGSGVYVSRDSGSTWQRMSKGLPVAPVGKTDVAIAPSNPKTMYALMETANQGSLWRSEDAGESWAVVSWDRRLIGRAGYYIRVDVNPQNDLEVLVASSSLHRSLDGGKTFRITDRGCGDCHDIWMDQRNPAHWATTGDGGAGITKNHGQSFQQFFLPIGQMYHVAIDERTPYWVYANRQDDGTMRGPTDQPVPVPNVPSYRLPARGGGSPFGGANTRVEWDTYLGGCESGFTIPVISDPEIVWATCYGNKVTRFDGRTGRARSVSPWMHTLDAPPVDLKYRCHWTAPIAPDPFDANTVYYGCQVVFKTSNGGQSWSVVSPDLSRNDPSRIVSSGGVIPDNLGQFYGSVVFAIAPSPIRRGLIWAGTNDGKVWISENGGARWTDLTRNVTGLPEWSTIRRIEPSRFNAGTAYVAVDMHLMDDRRPYLFKTADFGKTWTRIDGALPTGHPLDYVLTVAENPNREGMLFVGTGHAFHYSLDDGRTWKQHKDGLPAAPVTWIVASKPYHDVVLSTYGRGLWVMRDITTLEQQDKVAADAPLTLYEPPSGVRNGRGGSIAFTFTLKDAPRDSVTMEIVDSTNTVVRKIRAAGRAGLNRITWNLRYDHARPVELRTMAPDNPYVFEDGRFLGEETRPILHWGIEGPQRNGPLAAPGRFTARLTSGALTASTPFVIIKGTDVPNPAADLVASTQMQQRISRNMDETAEIVNRIEVMRKQIEDEVKVSKDATRTAALRDLDKKLLDVELILLSRADLQSDDKIFAERYRVYLNLLWLYGEVGTGAGDVAGGADFRPTDVHHQTLREIEVELTKARNAFKAFLDGDMKRFNELMAGRVAM